MITDAVLSGMIAVFDNYNKTLATKAGTEYKLGLWDTAGTQLTQDFMTCMTDDMVDIFAQDRKTLIACERYVHLLLLLLLLLILSRLLN